jgi:hypothetical protein
MSGLVLAVFLSFCYVWRFGLTPFLSWKQFFYKHFYCVGVSALINSLRLFHKPPSDWTSRRVISKRIHLIQSGPHSLSCETRLRKVRNRSARTKSVFRNTLSPLRSAALTSPVTKAFPKVQLLPPRVWSLIELTNRIRSVRLVGPSVEIHRFLPPPI